jgi:hypothetical protein
MATYICSMLNGGGDIRELISDNPEEIAAFVKREDRPGRAVYYCPNPLLPGARRRSIETVGEIKVLHVDIDFKDLENSPEQVDRVLQKLSYPPTEIRNSGGGRHAIWVLKEPIGRGPDFQSAIDTLKSLTSALCGDPAPSHPAMLLRFPGSHNSKREGTPVLCEVIWRSPAPAVDIGEITDMLEIELAGEAKFTRRIVANAGPALVTDGDHGGIDVEAQLAAIACGCIDTTWWTCMGSLLRHGASATEVYEKLLRAAENSPACQADPKKNKWGETLLEKLGRTLSNERDFLATALPPKQQERWHAAVREGRKPRLVYHPTHGIHVRDYKNSAQGEGSSNDSADDAGEIPHKPGPVLLNIPTFAAFNVATLPPRAWLYGKHYQRRVVSATIAPGGTGKTRLSMVESVVMATLRNLLGEQPLERCRVWYHNGEENRTELDRRFAAICQHYKIDMTELEGWLFYTTGNDLPLRVANGYAEFKIDDHLVTAMRNTVVAKKLDIIILDPLVTLHGVNENDNTRMNAVVRLFSSIADTCDCSVDLSHHMRKLSAGAADYSSEDMRGASAIKDAVRASRLLSLISQKEAEQAGIESFERPRYFRVDRGKGNHSAPAKAAVWRKFESVLLPNTDDVGVVTQWTYPGQDGAPSEERTAEDRREEAVFLDILDRFARNGKYVSDQGPRPAYTVFSEEPEAKRAKVGPAQLKEALKRLFAAEILRMEHYGPPTRRSHRIVRAAAAAPEEVVIQPD